MMQILLQLEDKELALDFLERYLARCPMVLVTLLPHLSDFAALCGPSVCQRMLSTINAEAFNIHPDVVVSVVVNVCRSLGLSKTAPSDLGKQFVVRLVDSMKPESQAQFVPLNDVHAMSQSWVTPCIDLLVDQSAFRHSGDTACKFLKAVVWASSQERKHPSYRRHYGTLPAVGPRSLIGAGVAKLCDTFGWNTLEKTLEEAVEKLCEN